MMTSSASESFAPVSASQQPQIKPEASAAPPQPQSQPQSQPPQPPQPPQNNLNGPHVRAGSSDDSQSADSEGETTTTMTKEEKEAAKQRRKRMKVSRACIHCQRSHMTCDSNRPCSRCVSKGLQHSCRDGMRKKAKYLSDVPDAYTGLNLEPARPKKTVQSNQCIEVTSSRNPPPLMPNSLPIHFDHLLSSNGPHSKHSGGSRSAFNGGLAARQHNWRNSGQNLPNLPSPSASDTNLYSMGVFNIQSQSQSPMAPQMTKSSTVAAQSYTYSSLRHGQVSQFDSGMPITGPNSNSPESPLNQAQNQSLGLSLGLGNSEQLGDSRNDAGNAGNSVGSEPGNVGNQRENSLQNPLNTGIPNQPGAGNSSKSFMSSALDLEYATLSNILNENLSDSLVLSPSLSGISEDDLTGPQDLRKESLLSSTVKKNLRRQSRHNTGNSINQYFLGAEINLDTFTFPDSGSNVTDENSPQERKKPPLSFAIGTGKDESPQPSGPPAELFTGTIPQAPPQQPAANVNADVGLGSAGSQPMSGTNSLEHMNSEYNVENSRIPNTASGVLLYREPADIYSRIKEPFSYTPGYHYLIAYLRSRFSRPQLVEMAKCMAEYRPSFIACTNTLKEDDLIFMEQCFQRTLLEYEKYISISGTPTIVWRRTGQVAYVGKEFCILTGWSKERLLNQQTFIVELMDDKSVLEYFQLFSKMAFGDFRGATMAECTLLTPRNQKVKTAGMWTVKRDVFGIPMMVIGNVSTGKGGKKNGERFEVDVLTV